MDKRNSLCLVPFTHSTAAIQSPAPIREKFKCKYPQTCVEVGEEETWTSL